MGKNKIKKTGNELTSQIKPNELVREWGHGEAFFQALALYGLKVTGAKSKNGKLNVSVAGVRGNSYSYVISLQRIIRPVGIEAYGDEARDAHLHIAGQNREIRALTTAASENWASRPTTSVRGARVALG